MVSKYMEEKDTFYRGLAFSAERKMLPLAPPCLNCHCSPSFNRLARYNVNKTLSRQSNPKC